MIDKISKNNNINQSSVKHTEMTTETDWNYVIVYDKHAKVARLIWLIEF
jgi:hypothetical protein